jgi:hypothetical protein
MGMPLSNSLKPQPKARYVRRGMPKKTSERGEVPRPWYAAAVRHASTHGRTVNQGDLAALLGRTPQIISMRMNGHLPIGLEAWIALLAILGLPLDWKPPPIED